MNKIESARANLIEHIAELPEHLQEDIKVLINATYKPPLRVEIIDEKHQSFNGKIYHINSTGHYERAEMLHRVVAEYYFGEIPEGHQVHHKSKDETGDFDKNKNNIENLEILSRSEHYEIHKPSRDKKKIRKFICENCGKEYEATNMGNNNFCSRKCAYAVIDKRRSEERKCAYCGTTFTTCKHRSTECCSLSCAAKLRWQRLKKRSDENGTS